MRSFSESYRDAGVNIEAGYEGVKLMKKHVQRTMIPGVVSDIGGFGGLFAPDLTGMSEPVLVSGTDGVGTKQRIAQLMNKHDSVGIDCVAMCVNDIICCGAKPIFFLDYIAIGKNEPEKVATLVSGVAEGCVQSGCALIGGETAEHPGTMSADDYDLAGFAVGIVDRAKIIDHDRMRPGDVVIALTSSGIHSNGYSLVRKVFNVEHADLGAYVDELGCTLGEELLRPTKIYVKPVLAAMDVADVHGIIKGDHIPFFDIFRRHMFHIDKASRGDGRFHTAADHRIKRISQHPRNRQRYTGRNQKHQQQRAQTAAQNRRNIPSRFFSVLFLFVH